ncbi:hypothetical protein IQ06DRAFT_127430 [Phaeosphaeriaceae sp. SRC1lsM3a]|nr:hypothetical protein IQ06DRAFT_127430 [Stagonospora sp. SRC1lsM3a]
MSDYSIYPLSDGTRAETFCTGTLDAFQSAKRGVTPCTDASRSSMSSLTSPPLSAHPPEYRELRPAPLPSSYHLDRPLMPRVRNEPNSDKGAEQPRQLIRVTKHPKRYKCNECAKSYAHAKNLREHKAKHRSERYPCDICGESVAEKRNLPRHKHLKHGIQHTSTTPSERHITLDPRHGSQEATIQKKTLNYECDTGRDCNT